MKRLIGGRFRCVSHVDLGDIPFHHLPVTPATKFDQEIALAKLIDSTATDLVVLAPPVGAMGAAAVDADAGDVAGVEVGSVGVGSVGVEPGFTGSDGSIGNGFSVVRWRAERQGPPVPLDRTREWRSPDRA